MATGTVRPARDRQRRPGDTGRPHRQRVAAGGSSA